MMLHFVKCSAEKVERKYENSASNIWFNDPVNLAMCYSFAKSTWMKGFPSIIFSFHHAAVDWIYDNEEDRDNDYDGLIDIYTSFVGKK